MERAAFVRPTRAEVIAALAWIAAVVAVSVFTARICALLPGWGRSGTNPAVIIEVTWRAANLAHAFDRGGLLLAGGWAALFSAIVALPDRPGSLVWLFFPAALSATWVAIAQAVVEKAHQEWPLPPAWFIAARLASSAMILPLGVLLLAACGWLVVAARQALAPRATPDVELLRALAPMALVVVLLPHEVEREAARVLARVELATALRPTLFGLLVLALFALRLRFARDLESGEERREELR